VRDLPTFIALTTIMNHSKNKFNIEVNNNVENFFSIEHYRQQLSEDGNLTQLKCQYSKTLPEINNENSGKFWDNKNFDHLISEISNPMAWDRLMTAGSWINKTPNIIDVLDIGIGSAELEQALYVKDYRLTGIDVSQKSLNEAKKRFKQFSFIKRDIVISPVGTNKFDLVVALEVLEHIQPSKIFSVLSKIYKSLKSNGYFLCSVPLNEGLHALITKHNSNPNAHLREYTYPLITSELKIAGFSIIKSKTFFAFHNNYKLKSLISQFFFKNKANNVLILAQKNG